MANKEEILELLNGSLEEVAKEANEIRKHFCGNEFDLCTIINGKSGKCSEDCKYCAQSAWYPTQVEEYPLLEEDILVRQAKYNERKGVRRYSVVTSGKRLSDDEIKQLCSSIIKIKKETNISVCGSLGLLDKTAYLQLKDAGISRIHNNLETSRKYFSSICTTHSYDEKMESVKAALSVGLGVCSGGIMGLGETMEDRIDMAITLRELGVNSVPVNILNPIQGTPFEKNRILSIEEIQWIVAMLRFVLPKAFIRLAGGRGLLEDKGRKCFLSGANAAITGDMLTTAGITIESDMDMLRELEYRIII